jgi:NADH-quinone oxidoreductase subunit L
MKEGTVLCERTSKPFHGFETAWPLPEKREATANGEGEPPAAAPAPHETVAADMHDALEHGEHLVHSWVFWAFVVGIGGGFLVYRDGYKIVGPLTSRGPLLYIRIWLYRRMYFDELYNELFVKVAIRGTSMLAGAFDKYIIDGIVNLAAWAVKGLSVIAGLSDKYFVDGAVNGIATVTQDLGAAVRAPQSGRVRMYVTILMCAVALGLTVAILIALS